MSVNANASPRRVIRSRWNSPVGGTYLHGGIGSQQVGGRDLLDAGVVEDGPQRTLHTIDVAHLGRDEEVEVLGEPSEAEEVQRGAAEDDVTHALALEGFEDSTCRFEVHLGPVPPIV